MESKHTNSPIAFLCPSYLACACMSWVTRVDLASNWCLMRRSQLIKTFASYVKQISGMISGDLLGVHSAREIPVLIPNTEVKPGSGDYTARAGN